MDSRTDRPKRIVVLGAGIIGTSVAWALMRDGHEVVVIDRHASSGQGTSFANGGHIATGDALPWTSFDFIGRLFMGMWRRDGAMRLHLRADPAQWRWLAGMVLNVSSLSWRLRAHHLLSMAAFSQACFNEWQPLLKAMEFEVSSRGVLHLFSGRTAFTRAEAHVRLMEHNGVAVEMLDARQSMQKEPALTKAVQYRRIRAGVFFPNDKTGDARLFTEKLTAAAKAQGVSFLFDHKITGVAIKHNRLEEVLTDRGSVGADIFVLALGTASAGFTRHFGLHLPVYPVCGYSVTMETNGAHAPLMGLVDETRRIVISRLGNQLRLAGLADIGVSKQDRARRSRLLLHAWRALLPESADPTTAQFWSGERPMTPDSLPILGRSPILDNLYLNTGHGSLGWTLCHASAQLTADLIARRAPAIDPTPFALTRFA